MSLERVSSISTKSKASSRFSFQPHSNTGKITKITKRITLKHPTSSPTSIYCCFRTVNLALQMFQILYLLNNWFFHHKCVRLATRVLPQQTIATQQTLPQKSRKCPLTYSKQGCHVLLVGIGVFHLQR